MILMRFYKYRISLWKEQCCGIGSGILCLFDPWIPDLGSRIPNQYFWELSDNFLGKKFYNSLKIGPYFFLQHFNNNIVFNFVKFMATKKVWQLIFFTPLFCSCFWIRDPRSGVRDLGFGINIPDPQHWPILKTKKGWSKTELFLARVQ